MEFPRWQFVSLKSWLEMEAIPGFIVGDVSSETMAKGHLVQDYEMPKNQGERPCGIRECRTRHRRGWLVRLTDGQLSHVGKDCGESLFGAEWSRQIRRVRAEKSADMQAKALAEARSDAAAAIREPVPLSPAEIDELKLMRSAIDELPEQVRYSLEARASDGNPRLYISRPPTEDEIKRAKFLKQNRPHTILEEVGRFKGLNALRPSQSIAAAMDRIERQKRNLEAAMKNESSDELRTQTKRLRDMRQELRAIQHQWRLFFEPSNVALMIYLHQVQKLYAKAVRLSADHWPRIDIHRA